MKYLTETEFEKFDSSLDPVPANDLIKHMSKFYSDRHIIEDLDCVLACCRNEADREKVRRYAKARRKAPGFNTSDYSHNNHSALGTIRPAHECIVCGREFAAKRRDARFCSPKCRKRGAPVTDNESETPIS